MTHIWPLKNCEKRSEAQTIKNAYFKNTNPCVKTLKTFI